MRNTPIVYRLLKSEDTKLLVHIPYTGWSPYWYLRGVLGKGAHIDFDSKNKAWRISAAYMSSISDHLAQMFGVCDVYNDVSTSQACTVSCRTAEVIDAWQCECVCGGLQHKGGLGALAGGKIRYVGELIIENQTKTVHWQVNGSAPQLVS